LKRILRKILGYWDIGILRYWDIEGGIGILKKILGY
jgi:hypothetical protein